MSLGGRIKMASSHDAESEMQIATITQILDLHSVQIQEIKQVLAKIKDALDYVLKILPEEE